MNIIKGIEMIPGVGGDSNIYVIDSHLLVDAGTGDFFGEAKEDIKKACDVPQIKTIVATHCHYDHSGGIKKFRDWLKAAVAVHEKDKKPLETGKGIYAGNAVPKIVTVDRKLRNGMKLNTPNFSFEVLHTPGHTPGSICLYDKEKRLLISGDTLSESGPGRADKGGDAQALRESLEMLSSLPIIYLLPGHGAPKSSGVNFHIRQILAQNRI